MIFVRYNDHYDRIITFNLDSVVTVETIKDEDAILVTLGNGREERLNVEVNEFWSKVLSDENNTKEYNEVEFDNNKPEVSTDEDFKHA